MSEYSHMILISRESYRVEFFTWRKQLLDAGIGTFAHNNVGNPFEKSSIPYHTHDFERDVIAHFGKLFGFPIHDTWGFLSHSDMYMGKTLLKKRTGLLPKAYFTKEDRRIDRTHQADAA